MELGGPGEYAFGYRRETLHALRYVVVSGSLVFCEVNCLTVIDPRMSASKTPVFLGRPGVENRSLGRRHGEKDPSRLPSRYFL